MESEKMRSLSERAKELECVYAVDGVLQDRDLTLPRMMMRLTEIIPAGFSVPDAAKIRIELMNEVYETKNFKNSEIIYRAPILIEGENVGEVLAGYRQKAGGAAYGLLDYEAKLMDTIVRRISQLALGRQRELSLLMNMLRQIDPEMLITIGEKLRIYLQDNIGSQAADMMRIPPSGGGYGETNVAIPAALPVDSGEYIKKMVEAAFKYISHDRVLSLFGGWMDEQRVLAFIKTVDQKGARVADILDAVRKFTGAVGEDQVGIFGRFNLAESWLKAELAHRFLTEDESLINRVISDFTIEDFRPMLERVIGSEGTKGNVGGKGAGQFTAVQILRRAAAENPLLQDVKIPRTWYIAADDIIEFLHYNGLEELNYYKYNPVFHLRMTYDGVIRKIKKARLPVHTVNMLRLVLEEMSDTPLIVRSSSLLEDKDKGAFSGKYKSLFLTNVGTREERLDALVDAVLEVYVSMYNPDSIQYRRERGLLNFTEQMGVMIQEVVGKKVGEYFLPHFAGVAMSRNTLRWSPRIKPEDGLVRLVMGLGTRAVDRVEDYPVMFAPGQPDLQINQTASDIIHYSPRRLDVIHERLGFMTVEADSFLKENYREIPNLCDYVSVCENDFIQNKNAFSLNPKEDRMLITFQQTLSSSDFPKKIKLMMDVLSEKLQTPVDIEFASDGESLYLLQCRTQSLGVTGDSAAIPQNIAWQDTVFTADKYISDGFLKDVAYVVYVDPEGYSRLDSREKLLAVGTAVGRLNDILPRKKFILMGPGRWGSRGDIQLGVRVTYSDISNTGALIEIARERHSYTPELSFGTHFFQDLVESGILYIPLYPENEGSVFRESFFTDGNNRLKSLLPEYAWLSETLKVVKVADISQGRSLTIRMNSELNQAIAYFSSEETALPKKKPSLKPKGLWKEWSLGGGAEHWQWRHYMAHEIAEAMDMERFGVKAVYLFGSTDTGTTGAGSDIDLLIHVKSKGSRIAPLREWLDGWSRALARINFLQTGYDIETLLDLHFVTDEDISAGDSFAMKIRSASDPATLLREL